MEKQKLRFPALVCLLASLTFLSIDRYFIKYDEFAGFLSKNNISSTKLKNFSDSLLYSFYRDYEDFSLRKNLQSLGEYEQARNIFYDAVLLHRENDNQRNILLIIVESLGFSLDKRVQSYLLDDLKKDNLNDIFDVDYTSLDAFKGSTTTAEFRELCGVKFNDYLAQLDNLICTPKILKSMGYEVYAAHPYLNGYFNRREWWKEIGFFKTYFMTGIKKDSLPRCSGSYQSLCDDSFFKYVFDDISQAHTPFFLYYLSIEGHLPAKIHSQKDYQECINITKTNRIICGNLIANKRFLQSVFTTLKGSKLTNLDVYIVGDHVPNSLLLKNKKIYNKNEVQVITLKSRL